MTTDIFGLPKPIAATSATAGVIKWVKSGYLITISVWKDKGHIWFKSPYLPDFIAEVKAMTGAKWHPNGKLWSVLDNQRNNFQLDYLRSRTEKTVPDPYARYNKSLIDESELGDLFAPRYNRWLKRDVTARSDQQSSTRFVITRRQCILAEEMGLGKTLTVILAMEWAQKTYGWADDDFWYVGPKSAVRAVERELIIWNSKVRPRMMTYEANVKLVKEGLLSSPAFVIFDESSRVKTHTSQRSQAALILANSVRDRYGSDGFVVLMTGTPAPKSPLDWWSQAEIACPGFLREGDIYKFQNRLAIVVKKESIAGGVYPQIVRWRENERRCNVCGEYQDHVNHVAGADGLFGNGQQEYHAFVKGVNEINLLSRRMQGLMLVKFKKDCLDLPEKIFEIVELKPNKATLRAAGLIAGTAKTAIEALTRLRELSDGFQYYERDEGMVDCPRCHGSKLTTEVVEVPLSCPNCTDPKNQKCIFDDPINQCPDHLPQLKEEQIVCPHCNVQGQVPKKIRDVKIIDTPKDQALEDDLDLMDEVGRIVFFGGFQATIDRITAKCLKLGWAVIRVDGRGWHGFLANGTKMEDKDFLSVFQDWKDKYPKVAFVAHPGSGGMALTLTASPVFVFYSNDFSGEYRSQAQDRGHRPGMDIARGVTIKDYIHLPSDLHVRNNLLEKRRLELMSLGDVQKWAEMESAERLI